MSFRMFATQINKFPTFTLHFLTEKFCKFRSYIYTLVLKTVCLHSPTLLTFQNKIFFYIFHSSYAVSVWALILSNYRQKVILYIPVTNSICCKEFHYDTLQYSQETLNIVLNSYVEGPRKKVIVLIRKFFSSLEPTFKHFKLFFELSFLSTYWTGTLRKIIYHQRPSALYKTFWH